MRTFDISILGWIHTIVCFIAVPTGLALLVMGKGTRRHKQIGRWYLVSMVVGCATALGLSAPIEGIAPGFNVFHWLSLVTLGALALAYIGARRQTRAPWAYLHPAGMIISYYMLIGALINEMFSRAQSLQVYRGTEIPGVLQGSTMMLFIVVLAAVMARTALRRVRLRTPAAAS